MSEETLGSRVVRRLTTNPEAFVGQHLEFTDKELKFLGPIETVDTVQKQDGTLVGIAIQTTWMVEADAKSPAWGHAKRTRRHEVYIRAEELDAASYIEEDDELHLTFPDGTSAVIMPEGNSISIDDITDHGY